MHEFGEIVLAQAQFTDTFELKVRPAVVLFEEYGNVVVLGITSNTRMKGIPLLTSEGAIKDSIIKTNYIFTITKEMIRKKLFTISENKKEMIRQKIITKLQA